MSGASLRPRTPTEAVDAAIRLAAGHLGSWVAVYALITLPAVAYWALNFDAIASPQGMAADQYRTFAIVNVVNVLVGALATGTLVAAMSEVYLGGALRIGAAFQLMLSRAPVLILAVLLRFVLFVLGLIAIVAPGVYVGSRTVCIEAVALLEPGRGGPLRVFGRTWSLAKDEVAHQFLTMLLVYVIILAGFAVSLVVAKALGAGVPMLNSLRSRRLIQTALLFFVQPIIPATVTVLYYDLRVRKEAFDLELMTNSLEAPAP